MNKNIVFVFRSLPSSSLGVCPSSSSSPATVSAAALLPRRAICHAVPSSSSSPAAAVAAAGAASASACSSLSSSSLLSSSFSLACSSSSSSRIPSIYSTFSLNFSGKAGEKKSEEKPKVTVLDDANTPPLPTAENAFRASLEPERKANQELYEKRAAIARELSPHHPIATHNADGTRRASDRVPALVDELLSLSITDLKLVIDGMSKKLGLEISAFNAAAAAPPAGGAGAGGAAPAAGAAAAKDAKPAAAAAPAVEKKSFDVRLDKFADKDKIKVIKEVRTATGLGLKESKDLVESVASGGKIIKKEMKKEEAEALIAKLKEAGAEASMV